VIHRDAVQKLSDALLARGGAPVWVVHDEIYREQTFIEEAGYFAAVYPYTIVTNSVSKSNALTGLRLGWVLAPAQIAASIVKVHAWLTSCADTFAQRVALHIFSTPGAIREHAPWYEDRCREVIAALQRSELRFISPEGSFYACVRLRDGMKSLEAAHALADRQNVIAVPGIAFGAAFEGWLRLSWVSEIAGLREGLARIKKFCGG
jgi:aspartate/methionine/tyrosine aminotransferase